MFYLPLVYTLGQLLQASYYILIKTLANYTLKTRLPKEFYDEKGRAIIDKIGVEEWFSGYRE
jgi:hypothetical protein